MSRKRFTQKMAWGLIVSMLMTSTGMTSFAKAITEGEVDGDYQLVKLHLDEGEFKSPMLFEKLDTATDDTPGVNTPSTPSEASPSTPSVSTASNSEEDEEYDEYAAEIELINDLVEEGWGLVPQASPSDTTTLAVVDGSLTEADIAYALEDGGYQKPDDAYIIWVEDENDPKSVIDLSGDGFELTKGTTDLYAKTVTVEDGYGWVEVSFGDESKWVYFDGGQPLKNELKEIDGETYYFDKDGYRKSGWQKFDEGWRYFRSDGTMVKHDSFKLRTIGEKGDRYAFGSDGLMLYGWVSSATNEMMNEADGWKEADHYFDPENGPLVTGLVEIEVNDGGVNKTYWFYFDPANDGLKLTNTEITDDGITWVLDQYGVATEKDEEPDEPIDTSAIDDAIAEANAAKEGVYVDNRSASQVSRGRRFVSQAVMDALDAAIAKAEAAMSTVDSQEEADAVAKELRAAIEAFKAAIQTGTRKSSGGGGGGSSSGSTSAGGSTSYQWSQDRDGDDTSWKLRRSDGSYVTGSVVTLEDGSTRVQIAWAQVGGAWYAFGSDGYAVSGWVLDLAAGHWYHIDINSGMNTGWHADPEDGRTYYLDPASGKMCTGWTQIDGKWYFFNPSAVAETWAFNAETGRWYHIGNEHRPLGSMYRNEMTPDGYYVDANGAWAEN